MALVRVRVQRKYRGPSRSRADGGGRLLRDVATKGNSGCGESSYERW